MSYGSDAERFIFVRVPRTGSTTLVKKFRREVPDFRRLTGQHAGAMTARHFWRDRWTAYHTLGCIRNPWDWLASAYAAGLNIGPLGDEPEPASLPFAQWARRRRTTPADWLLDRDGAVMVDEVRRLEDMDEPERWAASARQPYHHWYDDDLAHYVSHKCAREIDMGGYVFQEG